MKPVVEIDPASGFCFGVVTAINKAEQELDTDGSLYCLGHIVHNTAEVNRLGERGLETVTHERLATLHDAKVLLRAHGEPPSTYELARRNNITVIDATCPVVLKLQQRIKKAYSEAVAQADGTQIVIYGKKGHAEVNGLVGQTEGNAIVVQKADDLRAIDFSRPVDLYSQTTMSIEGLDAIVDEISRRMARGVRFEHHDTICRQVANRVERLRTFAKTHDVILFVTSAESSNGKVLYNECLAVNPRTHLVATEADLRPEWFLEAETIGICGATSTPRWLMEQVSDRVETIFDNPQP